MCDEIFEEHTVAVCEGGLEVSQQLLKLPFDHILYRKPGYEGCYAGSG